jgi:hypothetical protein
MAVVITISEEATQDELMADRREAPAGSAAGKRGRSRVRLRAIDRRRAIEAARAAEPSALGQIHQMGGKQGIACVGQMPHVRPARSPLPS